MPRALLTLTSGYLWYFNRLRLHPPACIYMWHQVLPMTVKVSNGGAQEDSCVHNPFNKVSKIIIQVASLNSATVPSFTVSGTTQVPGQLPTGIWQKTDFHSEHVQNLISKAKKLVNIHNVSLPSPLYKWGWELVNFLRAATSAKIYWQLQHHR